MNPLKIALMCLMVAICATAALALPLTLAEVKVDGTELLANAANRLDIVRGEEFDVRVELIADSDLSEVELQGFISGYEFNDLAEERLSDSVGPFDMKANVTYVKTLTLRLSDDVDVDEYKLRLIVSDRDSTEVIQSYNLFLDAERHDVRVKDVIVNPHTAVRAGSALLTTVRIENFGQRDQDDVKVVFSVPELGLTVADYLDELDADEQEETEEMFLRVPLCAEPGVYTTETYAQFNDGRRKTDMVRGSLTVIANPMCGSVNTGAGSDSGTGSIPQPSGSSASPVAVTWGSQLETINAGTSGIFPVTFTNTGSAARSFTLSAAAPQGFDIRVSPTSTVVLQRGQSTTLYLFVTPSSDMPLGAQTLTATISSGSGILYQGIVTANVASAPVDLSWKTVVEVLFIVLLGLLVVLAAVTGLSRLRGDKSSKPYY